MAMPADASPADPGTPITVITATWLETWITRLVLRGAARVHQVGVGVTSWPAALSGRVIVCGLAGGLSSVATPGTVIVPTWVGVPSGERFPCDESLVVALAAAARTLGHDVVSGLLLTSPTLVTGQDRARRAREGFVAVDMESATLLAQGSSGAVLRVVLDAPEREMSTVWEHPRTAFRQPGLWFEAVRLAIDAPRGTFLAARVVKRALAIMSAEH